ncbi:Glycosyltransferase [Dissulfuribacter thermophilus]|uniref:Glycosyltransferase n=1 Tax=Dissulfuribacter thermophilus TaxID=1156395 RepID=A0A1B9F7H4_9BACT|nr:glycosyltransferase family 4 protein [Dissulfuribacter thermophilus]OCC15887.1 Glycosyltransferase [Dissulfuribacter thermophilus]
MKVLHITTSFPSHSKDTAGPFILRLVRELEKTRDVSCTVLTPDGILKSAWPEDIKVVRCRYAPKKLQLLAQRPGGVPQALRKNRVMYFLLPTFLVSMWFNILKLSNSHDIIHAHWSISGFLASLTSLFKRRPIITTIHGSDFNLAKGNELYRYIQKKTLLDSSVIVGVSQTISNRLKVHFPQYSEKICFIPNGVSEDFFSVNPTFETLGQSIKFLYVGSLIPVKGVDLLIKAFCRLKNIDNWEITIVGDGPEREKLEMVCLDNKVNDRVTFLGSVEPDRIPRCMAQSHCLVLPSYSEGRPSVVLEAMAAGLPVIATDIEGTNELVLDGVNGWLFKPGDVKGLVDTLKAILNDPKKLMIFGARGRNMMIKWGLTWENTARQYKNIYAKTIINCD